MKLNANLTPHRRLNGVLSKPTEIPKIEKNYENLENKPQIESVELVGNKHLEEFGITECSSMDIINIFEEV